ncbi:hypothetical protein, conserved [Eimeria necatrix]|uniref:Uncharacterized protein n=1 Tax=Eimeria necatrix TaxID=51315 RepID=U6MZZ9_9EIME|nr:hypothetical protein, conserved [Eimeria necatrix]CDJ67285.1 hypothetical protein, conserved [Eimeria necatrix]
MIFTSQRVLWKLFPRLAQDKVRWMRLYCMATFGLGAAACTWAGQQDYSSKPSRTTFFYRQHLKALHKNKKITDEKYARLLTGVDL